MRAAVASRGALVLAHRGGTAAPAGQRLWSGGGHRGALTLTEQHGCNLVHRILTEPC